ncbi:MAG: (d)CMP kinase, partial [Chloroflexi bacterium]|nr:(d)CMP kinase [Chloroflexota bacterium]
ERASRRHREMAERGEKRRLQEVVIDVIKRDYRDYTREGSPITLAENAQIIETFDLTPEEVAKKIVDLAYRTDS